MSRSPSPRSQVPRRDPVIRRACRAIDEFLALPLLVVAGYGLLAVVSIVIDRSSPAWAHSLLRLFAEVISRAAAGNLLSAVATSVVTVTAITFSVLLLAVQQTASAMTPVVFDQFLRRRSNQLYLGMFVGLSLYAFIDLATIRPSVVPIFGATVALALTLLSLCALMLLIYSTVDQMRPSSVLQAIHDHAITARAAESAVIARTRRASCSCSPVLATIYASGDGFVTGLDLDAIADALAGTSDAEVTLRITLGSHVAFRQPIASIRGQDRLESEHAAEEVRRAIRLERDRNLKVDPSYAVTELGNIGWTGISSAKHNPQMGRGAIDRLQDLLARWSEEADGQSGGDHDDTPAVLPIVYEDSDVDHLIDTLMSMLAAAAESAQPEVAAHVLRVTAMLLGQLPPAPRRSLLQALIAALPALDAQVLTCPLELGLCELTDTLRSVDATEPAFAVAELLERKRASRPRGAAWSATDTLIR